MGQRSQIYIRATKSDGEKVLVARYLQWNYSHFMISRARAIIEEAHENMDDSYWKHEGRLRMARISEVNFDLRSIVLSIDIIEEFREQGEGSTFSDYVFCTQDNNDGKLLVDIDVVSKTVKYAFLSKEASLDTIMNGEQYMAWDIGYDDDEEESSAWRDRVRKYFDGETVETCEKNIAAISEMAVLMTSDEVRDFIEYDYGIKPTSTACVLTDDNCLKVSGVLGCETIIPALQVHKILEEYELRNAIEDVRGKIDDLEIDQDFSEDGLRNIAVIAIERKEDCDGIYEFYWNIVEDAIKEYSQRERISVIDSIEDFIGKAQADALKEGCVDVTRIEKRSDYKGDHAYYQIDAIYHSEYDGDIDFSFCCGDKYSFSGNLEFAKIDGYSLSWLGGNLEQIRDLELLGNEIMDVLDENEISIASVSIGGTGEMYTELEFHSDLGEDFIFDIWFTEGDKKCFVKAFAEYADSFDPEEHATSWYNNRTLSGVPQSIRELLKDADSINKKLKRTSKALYKIKL